MTRGPLTATAVLATLLGLLTSCGGDGGAAGPGPTRPAAPKPATSTSAPAPDGIRTGTPGPVPEDGLHPVFVAAVDVIRGRITFDLIRDSNARLRTLPVVPDVVVAVLWLNGGGADTEHITLKEFPAYLASDPATARTPFWLMVKEGRVTVIKEQFIPGRSG